MRPFVLDSRYQDLFRSVGGGVTAYRRLKKSDGRVISVQMALRDARGNAFRTTSFRPECSTGTKTVSLTKINRVESAVLGPFFFVEYADRKQGLQVSAKSALRLETTEQALKRMESVSLKVE